MSYTDICDHLSEMYQLSVSPSSITAITANILPDIEEWQTRSLESTYTIGWMPVTTKSEKIIP